MTQVESFQTRPRDVICYCNLFVITWMCKLILRFGYLFLNNCLASVLLAWFGKFVFTSISENNPNIPKAKSKNIQGIESAVIGEQGSEVNEDRAAGGAGRVLLLLVLNNQVQERSQNCVDKSMQLDHSRASHKDHNLANATLRGWLRYRRDLCHNRHTHRPLELHSLQPLGLHSLQSLHSLQPLGLHSLQSLKCHS